MAKKAAKKTNKKTAKKTAKKTGGKKPAGKSAKKPAGKKPAKKASMKPKKVSTGKGATPKEIGEAVVAHVNSRPTSDKELWKKHFHKNFTSIEGTGEAFTGMKAVEAKCQAWVDNHIIHSCKATGPFVGATGFSVEYDMDVESKDGSMPRMQMKEVGVYTVKNGKVVQEEFMYHGM